VGGQFTDLKITDVNNDRVNDLILTSIGAINIQIGNGDGTFVNTRTYATAANEGYLTVVDLNGDSIEDLITTGSDTGIRLRLGIGGGQYQSAQTYTTSGTHINVTAADVNGDGALDLVAANEANGVIEVFSGSGTGTFTFSKTYAVGSSGATNFQSIAASDFNGDGVDDILVANGNNSDVRLFTTQSQSKNATRFLNISIQAKAESLLPVLDTAFANLNARRASIGATSNRLDYASNANSVLAENLASAKSQIMDSDVASETAELTRQQILQQAGVAVLGQANASLSIVLKLLNF